MTDRDRLIELLFKVTEEKDCPQPDEIADYLLTNGVIISPCKVGDIVYVVSRKRGIRMRRDVFKAKVIDVSPTLYNGRVIKVEDDEKLIGYYEPWFVFPTKEEAEEKLKECDNNDR